MCSTLHKAFAGDVTSQHSQATKPAHPSDQLHHLSQLPLFVFLLHTVWCASAQLAQTDSWGDGTSNGSYPLTGKPLGGKCCANCQ
ncbi:hypothetical protein AAFF_G00137220 [Aldrovandia affinis]|uniref:Uncharacterized protein n=1 Tax=Aldrovandia affinis TaxID=143900 RepID=A0AAD7TC02_9TELE|nr:hypothetical protein AAFF_G00137220 [Aldrovandia affinis]